MKILRGIATALVFAGCTNPEMQKQQPTEDLGTVSNPDLVTPTMAMAPSPEPMPPASQAGPILFVTQIPIPANFTTIANPFGNQLTSMDAVPRGGDLWIRYPDGTTRNLTQAAGFGNDGQQGANAIAVREPSVHWDGRKAIFSMVVGAPTMRYQQGTWYWQLYEVTGLGASDTPVITKVKNQPADFNNVSPLYGSDDRILFTSDRPRSGERHLYPQLDEYEEAPTVTGIWSLDANSGDLFLVQHAPSGSFTPIVDSYGRILFTRWDHLQRDQQADSDSANPTYGTFNYADESANAAKLTNRDEVFPEPRADRTDLLAGTNLEGHSINHFFPWQVNEDGSEEETLNHIGRHELHGYFNRAFKDDSNLVEFNPGNRFNQNEIENLFHMKEDPLTPGVYFGVDAPEFYTNSAGQLVSMSAPPDRPADQIAVTYLTHRDTNSTDATANNSGKYRNPLPLSDGSLLAVHSAEIKLDYNYGTQQAPRSAYFFRMKKLEKQGSYYVAGTALTGGIMKSVTWWSPDEQRSFSGEMWELDPVEVRARTRPARRVPAMQTPEQSVFTQVGVDIAKFKQYLKDRGLALIVSRNVTSRDAADKQQPYNLKISGSATQTTGATGKVYEIAKLQLFQGDQIRGLDRTGRRVLAQVMHDANALAENPASVSLGSDGSLAAIVPARRAMSWQLTDGTGGPVVRERYWVSFQAGEIRVCASCHGLNSKDQAGGGVPMNEPAALKSLLEAWKAKQ